MVRAPSFCSHSLPMSSTPSYLVAWALFSMLLPMLLMHHWTNVSLTLHCLLSRSRTMAPPDSCFRKVPSIAKLRNTLPFLPTSSIPESAWGSVLLLYISPPSTQPVGETRLNIAKYHPPQKDARSVTIPHTCQARQLADGTCQVSQRALHVCLSMNEG